LVVRFTSGRFPSRQKDDEVRTNAYNNWLYSLQPQQPHIMMAEVM